MLKLSWILVLVGLTGCASDPVRYGIPNLHQVTAGVLRGGQPTLEGMRWLEANGYTNRVKLNLENDPVPAVHTIYEPINLCEQLFGFDKQKLDNAVKAIKPGTFVGCSHGQDRTGLVVAVYRVRVQHWTKAEAEKEMLDLGFHKSLWGLWKVWKDI